MIIYIIKLLLSLQSRYDVIIFDKCNPPIEGDTITVGELVAEYKRRK
jgi:hypothetical protein